MSHLLTHTEFLYTLFDSTRERILVVNPDGQITAANPAACNLLGHTPAQLIGLQLEDIIKGGLPEAGFSEKQPSQSLNLEARIRGRKFALHITTHPVKESNSWLLLLDPIKDKQESDDADLFRAEKIKTEALLDAIPDSIFIQDFEGNFLDYYPALDKGIIQSDSNIKGRNMSEVLPQHVQELFAKAFQKIKKEKQAQYLEFALDQGSSGFFEARLVPMNDHMVLTVVRDISQHVANEQALKEERGRLQHYLDSAASLFVVLKPDYSIALVNQKVCETLGFTRAALLDQNWLTFLGIRGERKRLKMLFDRTMRGKSRPTEYFESYIRTEQGDKRLIRWRNALLKDSGGSITGLVCSGVDITDQKAAEEGLRRSESTKQAILKAIPDVILLQDIEGKILGVQEGTPSMEFFREEMLSGKMVTKIFPHGVGEQMLEKIQDSCRSGDARELEFSLKTETGLRFYEARYVCMDAERVLAVVRDITRTKSTKRLLDVRNRALEAAGNGILIADARLPDLPVIYCNDAFTRITQYSREDVLGKNCRFLQGKDTESGKLKRIREALKKGVECRVVLRNYRKDGSLFWNELTITPISSEAGTVTHFIGVQNDVSELVFENERKDNTRRILEAITQDQPLEEITVALAKFLGNRLPGRWIHLARWSSKDLTLKGLSSHGMPVNLWRMFQNIIWDTSSECPCREAVKTKKPVLLKDLSRENNFGEFTTALKKEGVRSCWSYPILSSEKTVLGTCTFFSAQPGLPDESQLELMLDALQLTGLAIERHQTRTKLEETNQKLKSHAQTLEKDVAERTEEVASTVEKLLQTNLNLQEQIRTTREAEDRARASQALFGAIASNFPRGVIMVFDREYRFVHLEGEELERMSLGDWPFMGKLVTDTPGFSLKQREEIRTNIQQTLEGQHLSFDFKLGANSYAVNSTPLHMTDDSGWALLVFSNVTEQKKAEEDLLRALRIEQELNDLKSRFISMASHEFRTPLSAIQSSAILIGKQNEPGNEEKRLRYLGQIKKNVRNLVVILDDFLSLSRLEEGKMQCLPAYFDIMDLLRSVLEEMESHLKMGQHFSEDYEVTSLKVYLDRKLLHHILVNLLSNAIKYSPEKSSILIQLKREGDLLKLSVKDKGMGIPEEEQEQLFNRFFRAKNAVNIPGTGLGLHIVKHYSELMGGAISFKSQQGSGSTFTLSLPVTFKPKHHEEDTDH